MQLRTTKLPGMAIFLRPIITQIVITLISNRVHSQTRTGGLYLLRIFDFLTMFTVVKLGVESSVKSSNRPSLRLLALIALGGSMSWLELSIIEYDTLSLLLSPVLAVIQGVQILQIQRCYRRSNITPESFMLCFTGLTSVALAIPALISWLSTGVSGDASWESIDYLLIGMSVLFMPNYEYSCLWLQLHLTCYDYVVLEQTKYWVASMGQWFMQNMAHATVLALVGKLIMLAGLLIYSTELKQKLTKIAPLQLRP